MFSYSAKILTSQPMRLAITVAGISLCIVLMLFLLAAYYGVADGSVDYIRKNRADLWVLSSNAWNILRGSSILFTADAFDIQQIQGVKSVSSVLFLLTGIRKGDQQATVYLAGFDPEADLGGPPHIYEGRSVKSDKEIVLDKDFAIKFDLSLGESVKIRDTELEIVGLSDGTNALVIQYAFVTLDRAQRLIGYPGMATCFLVSAETGTDLNAISEGIKLKLDRVDVYDHETFLKNNIKELQTGFLPFIFTVAALGVVVLTAILSLLLSVNILEKRKDFAVFKILGSPRGFVSGMVISQSVLISLAGCLTAVVLYFPLVSFIERVTPELNTKTSLMQMILVVTVVLVMSVVSSLISMQRLRRIYALEAFS
ncbi:ABC transporter permease [bacterium]|nr:ABC transporter permease [bacterium]